jgi:hypothetical protein
MNEEEESRVILFGWYWNWVALQVLLGATFFVTGEVIALILAWISSMLFVIWMGWD